MASNKEAIDNLIDSFDFEAHWSKVDQIQTAKASNSINPIVSTMQEPNTKPLSLDSPLSPPIYQPVSPDVLPAGLQATSTIQTQNKPLRAIAPVNKASATNSAAAASASSPAMSKAQKRRRKIQERKRLSGGTAPVGAANSTTAANPGPSSSVAIGSQLNKPQVGNRSSQYEKQNIKFLVPFPTKSALTLTESQDFSQLLAMRWRNTVAAAAVSTTVVAADGTTYESSEARELVLFDGDPGKKNRFEHLLPMVNREQLAFDTYAKQAHQSHPMFSCSLPDDEKAYFLALQATLSRRRQLYPDYYRTVSALSLIPQQPAEPYAPEKEILKLQFKEVIKHQGGCSRLMPHSITLSNAPNISTSAAVLERTFPSQPAAVNEAQEAATRPRWKPPLVSHDLLAQRLARQAGCQFAIACGTLKRLLLTDTSQAWEFPAMVAPRCEGARLVCIDAPLPAGRTPLATAQAKLAQLKGFLKLTRPGDHAAKNQPKRGQQPPAKRRKLGNVADAEEDLTELETFGATENPEEKKVEAELNDASGYKSGLHQGEEKGNNSSTLADTNRDTAENLDAWVGPPVTYSVLQLGPHRILVRARRPPQLDASALAHLFAASGRGFAPRPEAARMCGSNGDLESQPNVPCRLRIRLERQPYFGCEIPAPAEIVADRIACLATGSSAAASKSLLLRTRCSAFDGRVLLYEMLALGDIGAGESVAFATSLTGLSALLKGLYQVNLDFEDSEGSAPRWLLLRHTAGDPVCRMMIADANSREFTLPNPLHSQPPFCCNAPAPSWCPLDGRLLSQPHLRDKRVPGLFDPRILSQEDQQRVRHNVKAPQQHHQQSGRKHDRFQAKRDAKRKNNEKTAAASLTRAKDPNSRRSQKSARWMTRIEAKKQQEGGGQPVPPRPIAFVKADDQE